MTVLKRTNYTERRMVIGYDEMLSHRFISADRKVQETVFESGKK